MKKFVCLPTTAKIGCKEIFASGRANFTMSSCRIPSIKDVRWVAQLQAAKIRIGGKVRKVKDFSSQDGLDAPELPSEHRLRKVMRQLAQPRVAKRDR